MPIVGNENLKAISREHHHGLLLSWKIRNGLKKQIDPLRIEKYVNWFYKEHLLPHFEIEEKYIFPILSKDNDLVKKALADHRRLIRVIASEKNILKKLITVEEELETHIRFEERILFNEIQEVATNEQLALIQLHHIEEKFEDNLTDPFWL